MDALSESSSHHRGLLLHCLLHCNNELEKPPRKIVQNLSNSWSHIDSESRHVDTNCCLLSACLPGCTYRLEDTHNLIIEIFGFQINGFV